MSVLPTVSKLLKVVTSSLSVVLAAILAFVGNIFFSAGVMDMPEIPSTFTPIVRFTVASDVHLKDSGGEAEAYRLGLMIRSSYKIAENSPGYKALDAISFVGDLTDRGTPTTLQKFKDICDDNFKTGIENLTVLGNHEFGHDKENTIANYESIVGLPYRFHKVINGVHFIGVSPDRGGSGYTVATQVWLDKQLKAAVADNPDNPIFVFQHHHIWGTVYGSLSWGNIDLNAVLSQYPQVIDFSGHSHYPLEDPRSLWQGAFTALGTSTLSYFEMEHFPLTGGQFPEGNRNAAQMWVVEVDAQGAVLLRGYDLLSDQFIGDPYYIATPADKTTFAYNTRNGRAKSEAPVFADDAQLTAVKNDDGTYAVKFPAADHAQIVRQYEIIVTQRFGGIAFRKTHLSDYYYYPRPTDYTIPVGELKAGKTYTATVVAFDAYYKPSKPITLTFTAQ